MPRGRRKGQSILPKKRPKVTDPLGLGIEYWRVVRGNLPKTEVAARANIDAASIIRATRGQRSLHMSSVKAVARVLGVSVPALFAQIDDDILLWVRENQEFVRVLMTLLR
jgi:hypothetical protein